jgi:phosphatidylglycerophosphate synthase
MLLLINHHTLGFALAGFSDWLDGFAAKSLNQQVLLMWFDQQNK